MAERIGCFGASGSGKTSEAFHMMRDMKLSRIVMVDPLGEARGWRGFKTVHSVNDAVKLMAKSPKGHKIAFEPVPGQEAFAASQMAEKVIAVQRNFDKHGSEILFVIDELNLSFPVHGGEAKAPAIAEICSRGRHYGINFIGVSQGVSEVSTRFRRNLSEVHILQQMGQADRKAACDLIDVSADTVRGLKRFDVLVWRNGEIKKKRTRKIP